MIGFSVPVLGSRLPSLRARYLRHLKRFCVIPFIIGCAMRRPFQRNGVSIVVVGLVVVEILLFECKGQL